MARMRVVIVGAGFGGFTLARALEGAPVDVTLVDRHNYHLFTPLLYQVASSLLDPSDVAFPTRKGFRRARNVRFRLGAVRRVDLERRELVLETGDPVPYDRLVLATGSTTNYFGLPEVERRSFGLKDLPEAIGLRNHVLECFERASRTATAEERREWLTFVVAGAGPTGVEYAGALAELVRLNLRRDFPEIDMREVRIHLVELSDRVLATFREPLSEYAGEELARRRIVVHTGRRLVAARENAVVLDGDEVLPTRTLVWTAGVRPNGPEFSEPVERTRAGRLVVDAYLRLAGREREYAIGDLASFVQDGAELPMVAPPAMQQARRLAGNLVREATGGKPLPFRYHDKGFMATIGRKAAVAQTDKLSLTGFIGWLGWLVLHLWYIVGVRNRLLVVAAWAYEYFRYDRPIRIIVRPTKRWEE